MNLGSHRLTGLALSGLVLVAALLRWYGLDSSLWGDEISSVQRARASFAYAFQNVSSPLSVWLIRWGALVFGEGERALRLYSFLAGTAAIPLMFLLGRRVAGPAAGLLAALLLALSAYHVHHSQHARYYALMMLAALVWILLAERALLTGRTRWLAAFALSGIAGLLIHEFAIPLYAAIAGGAFLAAACSPAFWRSPRAARRIGLFPLAVVVGGFGLAAVYIAQERIPVGLIALDSLVADEGGAEIGAAPAPDERPHYRLTPADYAAFLRTLVNYPAPSSPVDVLLAVLALVGVAAAGFRRPVIAGALVAVVVVPPLPLFFVDTTHSFAARYFSGAVPALLLLAALGATTLGALVVRAYRARSLDLPIPNRILAGAAFVAVLVGTLVSTQTVGLARYYTWHPEKDWRGLATIMAPLLQPDDHVHYLDPQGIGRWRFRTTVREYYFRQMLPNAEVYLQGLRESIGNPTPGEVAALLREHPHDTHWFYALVGSLGPAAPLLDDIADLRKEVNGLVLWVVGAPTRNLLQEELARRGEIGWTRAAEDEAFSGESAFAFASDEPVQIPFTIRVNEPGHDVPLDLRNESFVAWSDAGEPAGWSRVRGTVSPARQTIPGIAEAAPVLALLPGSEIEQAPREMRLPGQRLEVRALLFAEQADTLALGVRYQHAGQWDEVTTAHPGDAEWRTGTLEVTLPENTAPESVRVFLRCTVDAPGQAYAGQVTGRVVRVRPSLDPTKTYTLSMRLRYDNLRFAEESGNTRAGAGTISLAYHVPGEGDRWLALERFHGTSDWRLARYRIRPGRDIPKNAEWLMLQVLFYGTGRLWIDDIQLEEGAHPTPYTPGRRLPHDERF